MREEDKCDGYLVMEQRAERHDDTGSRDIHWGEEIGADHPKPSLTFKPSPPPPPRVGCKLNGGECKKGI